MAFTNINSVIVQRIYSVCSFTCKLEIVIILKDSINTAAGVMGLGWVENAIYFITSIESGKSEANIKTPVMNQAHFYWNQSCYCVNQCQLLLQNDTNTHL